MEDTYIRNTMDEIFAQLPLIIINCIKSKLLISYDTPMKAGISYVISNDSLMLYNKSKIKASKTVIPGLGKAPTLMESSKSPYCILNYGSCILGYMCNYDCPLDNKVVVKYRGLYLNSLLTVSKLKNYING